MVLNAVISRMLFKYYATDVDCFFPYVTIGSESPTTEDLSTVTLKTFSSSGSLNIVFNKIVSRIDLKPRAPVFFLIAFFAISAKASSLNSNSTFSNSNNF